MALTNSPDVCAPRTARSRPEGPPIAHVAPSSCGMLPLHGGQGLFASGLARCRPYGMDTDAPVQTQETKRESKDVMAPPRIRAQSIPSRVGHTRVRCAQCAGNCFCGRYFRYRGVVLPFPFVPHAPGACILRPVRRRALLCLCSLRPFPSPIMTASPTDP